MSLLRRASLGVALVGLVTVGMSVSAVADNVAVIGDELSASGALDLGDVCAGTTSSAGTLRFELQRRGDPNTNTWASQSSVVVTGAAGASGSGSLSLGSASVTTPADWATVAAKGDNLDVGTVGVSVSVHSGASLGQATATTTWSATGARYGSGSLTRTDSVDVTWRVVDCAAVDSTPPRVGYTLTPAEPDGGHGWYRQDVALDWTVVDPESAASVTGCEDTSYSADGVHVSECTATSSGGTTGPVTAAVKRDSTPPSVAAVVDGTLGEDDWYVGPVSVTWTVSDATSGLDPATDCAATTLTEDTSARTFTCTTRDLAGNQSVGSVTVKRDATTPEVSFTDGPADGASYWFGDPVPTSACVASDAMSGVDGCVATGASTSVGEHTLTASATDRAGNVGSATRRYTVRAWTLEGFYRPVVMGEGVVNTVKAGSTVPLKFNVLKGTTPMTTGIGAVFAARKVGCDGSDLQDPLEEVALTGGTALRYDAAGAQWVQNWATPVSGKGACYRGTLTTADGSSRSADFRLR